LTDAFARPAELRRTGRRQELITEAINGMLSGLDPHSAYLDQEAFKNGR